MGAERAVLRRAFIVGLLILGVACGAGGPAYAPPTTPEAKVALAVELAAEVAKDPERAEAVIEARGMTPDEVEALLAEIAADPEMSDAYAAARGR